VRTLEDLSGFFSFLFFSFLIVTYKRTLFRVCSQRTEVIDRWNYLQSSARFGILNLAGLPKVARQANLNYMLFCFLVFQRNKVTIINASSKSTVSICCKAIDAVWMFCYQSFHLVNHAIRNQQRRKIPSQDTYDSRQLNMSGKSVAAWRLNRLYKLALKQPPHSRSELHRIERNSVVIIFFWVRLGDVRVISIEISTRELISLLMPISHFVCSNVGMTQTAN